MYHQPGSTIAEEGAEEDTLCVICQAKPVDPVEVSPGSLSTLSRFDP